MLVISRKVIAPLRLGTGSSSSTIGAPNAALKAPTKSFSTNLRSSAPRTTSGSITQIWRSKLFSIGLLNRSHIYSQIRHHTSSSSSDESNGDLATVNWILKNGEVKPITEKVGMNLLEIAHKHGIDLEGACEASLACSTCHVIVEDPDVFEKTGEISDEENDMLDLAFGLTQTSRLGCQVKLSKELDGITVRLPSATRNMMVDGHIPKPH